MLKPSIGPALAALLVLACRPEHESPTTTTGTTGESLTTGAGGFSSTGAPPTTGASTATGSPTTTDTSSTLDVEDTDTTTPGSGFILPPESEPLVCDCPEGQMCVRSLGVDNWFISCALPPPGCDPADVCAPACAAACALPPPQPENCDGPERPEQWLECGEEAGYECSTWAGNCPAGEKCVAFPDFTNMLCQPVDAAPAAIGEPCTGPIDDPTAPDTCVAGAGCWGVDPMTKKRVCAAHCTGTPADPGCPPNTACQIDPLSLVAICVAA